ncbi:MAG: hypothetical protein RR100_04880 [Comamonas sp.]
MADGEHVVFLPERNLFYGCRCVAARIEKRFSGVTAGRRRREGSVVCGCGGLKKSLHSAGQFEDSHSAVHECALHVRRCSAKFSNKNGS